MSFASVEAGIGSRQAESAKLRQADFPLRAIAATSWALAAISAVGNVPSQILVFLLGSRTSQTHLPEFLLLAPRSLLGVARCRQHLLIRKVTGS
ncbi:hypothetical protein RJ639_027942 [Escallonia herrerae]|uniref:Uncharacterized protein n=1 Tax=Escallonia herrerae TaxID=1293975 RepID=A0AA89BFQ4_9ASTE|nr:hypothetical protein RJ639_027942 [Escallonia herrerae]